MKLDTIDTPNEQIALKDFSGFKSGACVSNAMGPSISKLEVPIHVHRILKFIYKL